MQLAVGIKIYTINTRIYTIQKHKYVSIYGYLEMNHELTDGSLNTQYLSVRPCLYLCLTGLLFVCLCCFLQYS